MSTGVIWNARLAIADLLARRNQPGDTRLAMRVMPGNGAYAAQLADEVYASDPESAKALLQKAVALNRYDAASWIQLGLLREAGNDLPQAEAALLRAANADSTFLPSWSLANFYFRRENAASFWYWAERAAQYVPDDATSLFRLAWYVSPNVGEIEERLQIQKPAMQGQMVNFLMTQGDAAGVIEAVSRLLPAKDQASLETLLSACDWLLASQHPDLAVGVWNGLAAQRRIPYAPLGAGVGDLVTNGKFERTPMGRGFDWHLATVEGVSSFLDAQPNALGFEFTREEPDSFLLMSEAAPLTAQESYALLVDYATTGIAPGSGLVWSVTDLRSGAVLARTTSLSAEAGGKAGACFTAPQGTSLVKLSFGYQRQPGTVRVQGKVALHEVRLVRAGAPACS